MSLKTNKIYCVLGQNNLYSYGMSKYLPTGGFKWLDRSNFTVDKYDEYDDNSLRGCLLEVDLDYTK